MNPGGGSGVIWLNSLPIGPIGPGSIGPPAQAKSTDQIVIAIFQHTKMNVRFLRVRFYLGG